MGDRQTTLDNSALDSQRLPHTETPQQLRTPRGVHTPRHEESRATPQGGDLQEANTPQSRTRNTLAYAGGNSISISAAYPFWYARFKRTLLRTLHSSIRRYERINTHITGSTGLKNKFFGLGFAAVLESEPPHPPLFFLGPLVTPSPALFLFPFPTYVIAKPCLSCGLWFTFVSSCFLTRVLNISLLLFSLLVFVGMLFVVVFLYLMLALKYI